MKTLITPTFVLSALIALLCGCELKINSTGDKSPTNCRCTAKQLDLVKKETDICNGTGYLSSYCFAQAKATHCEVVKNFEGT